MNHFTQIPSISKRLASIGLFLVLWGLHGQVFASADSAQFRLSALQDIVDAGDTVDLDIFIGGPDDPVNIVKEFEIEIESDSDLIDKSNIQFTFDTASLNAYFGTVFTSSSSVDGMGRLNIKSSCGVSGTTTARIGRVRFIVQDNVAGRQLLRFNFIKVSAKRVTAATAGGNPYKTQTDSVWIVRGYHQTPTAIKTDKKSNIRIYPNPVTDYMQVEGAMISQYELLKFNGAKIMSDTNVMTGSLRLDLSDQETGMYILLLQTGNEWTSYKVIKQ